MDNKQWEQLAIRKMYSCGRRMIVELYYMRGIELHMIGTILGVSKDDVRDYIISIDLPLRSEDVALTPPAKCISCEG